MIFDDITEVSIFLIDKSVDKLAKVIFNSKVIANYAAASIMQSIFNFFGFEIKVMSVFGKSEAGGVKTSTTTTTVTTSKENEELVVETLVIEELEEVKVGLPESLGLDAILTLGEDGNSQLHRAAILGDVDFIKHSLVAYYHLPKARQMIESLNYEGDSMLHLAKKNGHKEVLELVANVLTSAKVFDSPQSILELGTYLCWTSKAREFNAAYNEAMNSILSFPNKQNQQVYEIQSLIDQTDAYFGGQESGSYDSANSNLLLIGSE